MIHGDHVKEGEDATEAKEAALDLVETTFVGVKNPKLEVERGFRFWDAVSLSLSNFPSDPSRRTCSDSSLLPLSRFAAARRHSFTFVLSGRKASQLHRYSEARHGTVRGGRCLVAAYATLGGCGRGRGRRSISLMDLVFELESSRTIIRSSSSSHPPFV